METHKLKDGKEFFAGVPEVDPTFVPYGPFNDIVKIVESGLFYTINIVGHTGNGKTLMVEQAHAVAGKPMVRYQVTEETDRDDLLGGIRLVGGDTEPFEGPVPVAMRLGATLLLDEVDHGKNPLICLQPVLENKPIILSKSGTVVRPIKGFNVMATANTKGKGDDDGGRYVGTNVLNFAFLDRVDETIEHDYPCSEVERQILLGKLKSFGGNVDHDFVKKLASWAEICRIGYNNGSVTEIISTRRLVSICRAYTIFGPDRIGAIKRCIRGFDSDTQDSFLQTYTSVDEHVTKNPTVPVVADDEVPW